MTVKNKEFRKRELTWNDKKLAEKIRQIRLEKGLTQEKLAELLGVNHSYVTYIENGHRGMSLSMLYKIARVLNVKVRDLITF